MQIYAVFLQPNLPQELTSLLAEHVQVLQQNEATMQFVYCTRFEPFSRFLECDVVKRDDRNPDHNWTVYIPLELVITIAEVGPDKPGPGFLSKI